MLFITILRRRKLRPNLLEPFSFDVLRLSEVRPSGQELGLCPVSQHDWALRGQGWMPSGMGAEQGVEGGRRPGHFLGTYSRLLGTWRHAAGESDGTPLLGHFTAVSVAALPSDGVALVSLWSLSLEITLPVFPTSLPGL